MQLLLLSNSRSPEGHYLQHALEAMAEIAGPRRRAVFVPFAGVSIAWDAYTERVQESLASLPFEIEGLHRAQDAHAALEAAEMIMVGGGNSFALLKHCRERGLLPRIAARVREQQVPYIGWSAGSNLACPTIRTTNDMPIVEPGGFDALGLVPFQLNPHYTNELPAGHQGETRDQRIAEFLVANPNATVLGLPEGDWLRVSPQGVQLHGTRPARLFRAGEPVQDIDAPAVLPL